VCLPGFGQDCTCETDLFLNFSCTDHLHMSYAVAFYHFSTTVIGRITNRTIAENCGLPSGAYLYGAIVSVVVLVLTCLILVLTYRRSSGRVRLAHQFTFGYISLFCLVFWGTFVSAGRSLFAPRR